MKTVHQVIHIIHILIPHRFSISTVSFPPIFFSWELCYTPYRVGV